MEGSLNKWLDAWGYSEASGSLHVRAESVPGDHPYRTEIGSLGPRGAIRAKAVFDVEGVPTICFLEGDNNVEDDRELMRSVRERAWNQNLVSIVLVVDDTHALAAPTSLPDASFEQIEFQQARPFGEFSEADIQSGEVFARHASWFAPENRVDRQLLSNLQVIVDALIKEGLHKSAAQLLMAQVMFVAYLEHRGIVGDEYRRQRKVGSLFELAERADRSGVIALMASIKDFNGDLLEPDGGRQVWRNFTDVGFQRLNEFLAPRRYGLRPEKLLALRLPFHPSRADIRHLRVFPCGGQARRRRLLHATAPRHPCGESGLHWLGKHPQRAGIGWGLWVGDSVDDRLSSHAGLRRGQDGQTVDV